MSNKPKLYTHRRKAYMSRRIVKATIFIGKNKGADQLRSNCEADQRLCFRCTDRTIPLLSNSKISSLLPSSVSVQLGLCRTWSRPKLLVFLCTGRCGSLEVFGKRTRDTTTRNVKTNALICYVDAFSYDAACSNDLQAAS